MQQAFSPLLPASLDVARGRRLLERVVLAVPAFAALARSDAADLLVHSHVVEARRGGLIARRGECAPGVLVIAAGWAKLALRTAAGGERVVRLMGPGECFGLAAAVLDRPSPLEVRAIENLTVAVVSLLSVRRLMAHDAVFASAVARVLASKFLDVLDELDSSAHLSALQRLACFLESIARPAGSGWTAHLPATKTNIAARLGVKKETLSRLLHALAGRGLISVRGRDVAILDRGGLAALAAGSG